MPEERQIALELVGEAVDAGASRSKACDALGIDERTVRRWKRQLQASSQLKDRRKQAGVARVPANKLTEKEKARIIEVCNREEYRSSAPSQIVPRLADRGIYIASESSFYRVLREANQLHHRGRARAPRTVIKPKGYKAEAPNQVWSWDITYLASAVRGRFYYLYMVEDIYSRKIICWEVHERESAEHASKLIRKGCLAENIRREELVLHSDNGSPMKGATMLATLQRLGVTPSFSRPAVSDDNPYSESLFRTLKYCPAYPDKPFESIEKTCGWVHRFVQWYNEKHRHSAIRYVTPGQRHRGEDTALLEKRKELYELARARNPRRWSGKIRDWNPVDEVWLNPPKEIRAKEHGFGN
uniref:Transposase InsO and inactivated derivatives n=1 Tax=Candidatus Kentrum sp. DK TaxID=2126562 RepID=A0A450THH7_9GAMM|nr:MAG: Transposase InsO and inactivated derivatives [Candidatus Kentron sp. DK]